MPIEMIPQMVADASRRAVAGEGQNGGFYVPSDIKVIGVGGAGGNAVQHMIEGGMRNVEFICANTDPQALQKLREDLEKQEGAVIPTMIHLGGDMYGAGGRPEVARAAAEKSLEPIREAIRGGKIVFLAAGMGKGTGTGATPVIAKIAKEMGILTVAVLTRPARFEGRERAELAEAGVQEVAASGDAHLVLLNDNIMAMVRVERPKERVSFADAYKMVDSVLFRLVQGLARTITGAGMVNVDLQDIRNTLQDCGRMMVGVGRATGENRVETALRAALDCPLLEGVGLSSNVKAYICIIRCVPEELGYEEYMQAQEFLSEKTGGARSFLGDLPGDGLAEGELEIIIIAAGLQDQADQNGGASGQEAPSDGGAPVPGNVATIPELSAAQAMPMTLLGERTGTNDASPAIMPAATYRQTALPNQQMAASASGLAPAAIAPGMVPYQQGVARAAVPGVSSVHGNASYAQMPFGGVAAVQPAPVARPPGGEFAGVNTQGLTSTRGERNQRMGQQQPAATPGMQPAASSPRPAGGSSLDPRRGNYEAPSFQNQAN